MITIRIYKTLLQECSLNIQHVRAFLLHKYFLNVQRKIKKKLTDVSKRYSMGTKCLKNAELKKAQFLVYNIFQDFSNNSLCLISNRKNNVQLLSWFDYVSTCLFYLFSLLYLWEFNNIISLLFLPLNTLYTSPCYLSNIRPLFSLIAVTCIFVYVYECIFLNR